MNGDVERLCERRFWHRLVPSYPKNSNFDPSSLFGSPMIALEENFGTALSGFGGTHRTEPAGSQQNQQNQQTQLLLLPRREKEKAEPTACGVGLGTGTADANGGVLPMQAIGLVVCRSLSTGLEMRHTRPPKSPLFLSQCPINEIVTFMFSRRELNCETGRMGWAEGALLT
jgi:hypothetical protein